jgi:hypothetical protein
MECFVSPALAFSQVEDSAAVFRNYCHLAVRKARYGDATYTAVGRSTVRECLCGCQRREAEAKDGNGAF